MPASTETRGGGVAEASRSVNTTMRRYGPYIDGAERQPASGDYFETQDPYSGESWALVARCTAKDVDDAVAAAKRAFDGWSGLRPSQRGRMLRNFADAIVANA